MRTTKYKCDRCGKEDETNAIDLHRIGVHIDTFTMCDWGEKAINNEWCRECINEYLPGYFIRRTHEDTTMVMKIAPKIIEKIITLITKGRKEVAG